MKDEKYQPFVLLGTARTGSSMLWSFLNSHPYILCLRGVFGSKNKINFGKHYPSFPAEYYSEELVKFRNENPIKFVENYVFKNYVKHYKAVGFKYFYNHGRHLTNSNSILDYFESNRSVKFIHLKRRNLLHSLFSYKRALHESKWQNLNSDFKTTISISECEQYFSTINYHYLLFDQKFENRTLNVYYEELASNENGEFERICNFIDVPYQHLTTQTRKNKCLDISLNILNYHELKSYYSKTRFYNFFSG